jgi:uncharacterized membrane protein
MMASPPPRGPPPPQAGQAPLNCRYGNSPSRPLAFGALAMQLWHTHNAPEVTLVNTLQIALRLVHIVGGSFWVGWVVYNALFLFPAVRDAGPDGAKVSAGIMKRRFAEITPIVALLTIGSGVWLYARASVGFDAAYLRSAPGLAFGIGGAISMLAFLIGWFVMRAAMLRTAELVRLSESGGPSERATTMATVQMLRARAARAGGQVAILLTVSAALMAVARYL